MEALAVKDVTQEEAPVISVTGRRWRMRRHASADAIAISQQLGESELIGRILAIRGITPADAPSFLAPTLRNLLPDPLHLKDMEKAARRIAQEVVDGQQSAAREGKPPNTAHRPPATIAIFGDYDVDGATSSALLVRYFRALGLEPLVHIPDRMKEGYGPNAPALMALKEKGARLVITVDCGTMAHEPLAAAKAAGLEVIVVDHHKGEARLPEAYAVVNPNRADETSPHTQLAAVGVTFLLMVAVNKALREMGSFTPHPNPPPQGGRVKEWAPPQGGRENNAAAAYSSPLRGEDKGGGEGLREPDLLSFLDLVALGTICDVVPLTGVNRALVAQGLKVMRQRANHGITAAMDVARLAEPPGTYHAGFIIGPRINAGGRVGQADLGVRLLTTEDPDEARGHAEALDRFNAERKAIESGVMDEALEEAAKLPASDAVIVVAREGWHPGVIGIVAGRLKEQYNKPTAVIALKDGMGKASARSISGIDLGAEVIAAVQAGLLLGGGGHAMAAGFSVAGAQLGPLRDFFNQRLSAKMGEFARERELSIDSMLSLQGLTIELAHMLERAGPFGAGNPSVRLWLPQVKVVHSDVVGEAHVRVVLADAQAGSPSGGLKAMAFRAAGQPLGDALLGARGRALHVAGQARINVWQARESVDFFIDDAAWA